MANEALTGSRHDKPLQIDDDFPFVWGRYPSPGLCADRLVGTFRRVRKNIFVITPPLASPVTTQRFNLVRIYRDAISICRRRRVSHRSKLIRGLIVPEHELLRNSAAHVTFRRQCDTLSFVLMEQKKRKTFNFFFLLIYSYLYLLSSSVFKSLMEIGKIEIVKFKQRQYQKCQALHWFVLHKCANTIQSRRSNKI